MPYLLKLPAHPNMSNKETNSTAYEPLRSIYLNNRKVEIMGYRCPRSVYSMYSVCITHTLAVTTIPLLSILPSETVDTKFKNLI